MTLTESNLSLLNREQRAIVLLQWERHHHQDHQIDFDYSGEGDLFNNFAIKRGVWDPILASGRYHAKFLFYNTCLYHNRSVLDMGCGTGLLGLVMAKCGAKKVLLTDISPAAVENARINAKSLGLEDIVDVRQSDLFEKVDGRFDLILWSIPFFPGYPPAGDTIAASMMMPPELFERFLYGARYRLNSRGCLIIPSFDLGGDCNNPGIVGRRLGYDVKTLWEHESTNGIQMGMLYFHHLTPKKA